MLRLAGEIGLPVIIQLRIQDAKAQKPLFSMPDVDVSKAIEIAKKTPETNIILSRIKWGEAQRYAEHIIRLENLWIKYI